MIRLKEVNQSNLIWRKNVGVYLVNQRMWINLIFVSDSFEDDILQTIRAFSHHKVKVKVKKETLDFYIRNSNDLAFINVIEQVKKASRVNNLIIEN